MSVKSNLCFILGILILSLISCKNDVSPSDSKPIENVRVKVPSFNQDSAFVFIEKQLSFGPRVPGSEPHKLCKEWLVKKFEGYGATVISQDFLAGVYTGEQLASSNIIAQFNPKKSTRIILSAHWDSRFIGEEDADSEKKSKPIPGADDAGSGVGVLLEIGRIINANSIDMGIDIILWDAEDQGQRGGRGTETTWCLGSQYWAKHKHKSGYKPIYGINLDMVGAKNPRFGKDQVSMQYAGVVMNKVWKLASSMGYSDMFVDVETGGLTDDHTFINIVAGIPMIDIINQPLGSKTGFGPHWHTHQDDINAIDKRSLKVVGQVVTATIYKESDGSIKSFE